MTDRNRDLPKNHCYFTCETMTAQQYAQRHGSAPEMIVKQK